MITSEQTKAARMLLNWRQMTLARSAGYDVTFVHDFENERRALAPEACAAIRRALEDAGVDFPIGGPPRLKSGAAPPANWWDAPREGEQ